MIYLFGIAITWILASLLVATLWYFFMSGVKRKERFYVLEKTLLKDKNTVVEKEEIK